MRSANIGISTENGMPSRLTLPSSSRMSRIGALRATQLKPSRIRCTADPTCFCALRGTFIMDSPVITAM
jgi:hypothetical protein